ncbi:MAG: extracellular solute-binding protein [Oscillospiraceae bacterium]|nr:extracellular solute-binding protein [Oscillospiraceae bacterium]
MKHKRIFAALTAALLLLCGCQRLDSADVVPAQEPVTETESAAEAVPFAEDKLTTTVRLEEVKYPEGVNGFGIEPTADGFLGIGNKGRGETSIYRYDLSLKAPQETVLIQPAPYDGYYCQGQVTDVTDDGFCTLAIMENHSNLTPEDWNAEDFDWDLYHASCDSHYYLCRYSKDGTLTDKRKVEGLEDYKWIQGSDRYDQIDELYTCAGGSYLLLHDGTILRIEEDGTLTETSPATFDKDDYHNYVTCSLLLPDRDGKPLYCLNCNVINAVDNSFKCVTGISEFDEQTGKPGEPIFNTETESASYAASPGGCGDYRLFITVGYETLGIRDDGTTEVVIDWKASNYDPLKVTPLSDGTFVTQYNGKLYHVTRLPSSEIKEKQTIRIGVMRYMGEDFVQKFNQTHEDYQLEVELYQTDDPDANEDKAQQDALDKLKLAVVSDNAPDLILINEAHEQVLKLGSRGVFADLTPFMETDPEVNNDKMLPNVLTALQHPNGALYALPRGFKVKSLAVKEKFGVPENWTLDDMYALYEGAGDRLYYWTTKEQMLQFFLTGMDFTDEVAGTCSFDSQDFVRVLEFCNRYPLVSNEPENNKESMDSMETYSQWALDHYLRYQRDEDYLYFTGFSAMGTGQIASSYSYTKGDLGGDFTLAGYPSNNGQGGKIYDGYEMAILNTCKDKDAAWEVVRTYVTSNDTTGWDTGYSLFEDQFEEQLDNEMYIWEFGNKTDDEYYQDDSKVYRLTQEERDGLEQYIRSCNTFMMVDTVVKNIAIEEAGKYFAGDCTAEDAAKAIQGRASVYLAEQS